MMKSLCVAIICKNEQEHIGAAIKSILPIADKFVILDTGSTDRTEEVVRSIIPPDMLHFEVYLSASEQDADGDWKLWDFSKARNRSLELAEGKGCTHIMWVDSDDEILDTRPIRRAMYRADVDAWNMFIEAGGPKWLHCRMWKMECKVRFNGRIHEYPIVHHLKVGTCYTTIRHNGEPVAHQENSNPRNLRILLREWEDNQGARTAFYMACTYRDSGQLLAAIHWFHVRIAFGDAFRDEYLFSLLYLARCLRFTNQADAAFECMEYARIMAPDWAEFIMEQANIQYCDGEYQHAIDLALLALDMPIIPSALWREAGAYRDQPARLISWCHEHLGDIKQAIVWADITNERIGHHDADWQNRFNRLVAQYAAKDDPKATRVPNNRRKVAFVRPGAIGDIIMTLNLIPEYKKAHPDTDVHFFCAAQYGRHDTLLPLILQSGAEVVMDSAQINSWAASYEKVHYLVGYQIDWEKNDRLPMDRHLLEYFMAEIGLECDGLPCAALPKPKRPDCAPAGDYITMQTRAGWSKYKEWPQERWDEVMAAFPETQFISINYEEGLTLYENIALVANAKLHLGVDSFANHLTHIYQVPAVILFGSTQPEVLGYPHNINLSAGLSCQKMCYRETAEWSTMKRGECINITECGLHRCMDSVTVEMVVKAI